MTDDELRKFGGPAFPESCGAEGYRANVYPGMTLRDYFAAQAMPAILRLLPGPEWDEAQIAGIAYDHADAMLAERQK